MQFEEIEELAKVGKKPPSRLIDLYAYELLKLCYDEFRRTHNLDQAKEQKRKIYLAWKEEDIFRKLKESFKDIHALKIYADGTYAVEILDKNKNCIYTKKLLTI